MKRPLVVDQGSATRLTGSDFHTNFFAMRLLAAAETAEIFRIELFGTKIFGVGGNPAESGTGVMSHNFLLEEPDLSG